MTKRQRRGGDRYRKPSFEYHEFRRLLASGPRVLSITPTEVRNATFDHIDVSFSSDIDASSVAPIDFTLDGPAGTVGVSGVTQLTSSSFRFEFIPLTVRGDYRAVIGPDILLAGNAMN